jgi:GGDEF domain-containing protein
MVADLAGSLRAMSYTQARRLIVAAGLMVLALVAGVMYARRVETVEVVAVLLFVPVFLALLKWNIPGGVVSALAAGAVYIALRWSAIHAVGFGSFSGLVVSRFVGLLAFGLVGGWANSTLRTSLAKLDLYDQIDDATGLFNARYFVLETDLEQARARRYQTFFSVSLVDIPVTWFEGLSHRQRRRVLRDLGRLLAGSIRTVDRAVHSADRGRHRLAVILPETQGDGARLFTSRLAGRITEWLAGQGVAGDGPVPSVTACFPEDESLLQQLRDEFTALDHAEHPLVPESVLPSDPAGP